MGGSKAPFDQTLVRKVGRVWRRLAARSLCEVCGAREECDLREAIDALTGVRLAKAVIMECGDYVPVIGFTDAKGLEGRFNTFRRGKGWANRVVVGTRVALCDLSAPGGRLVGTARVVGVHAALLGELLGTHAAGNHLMRDADPAAAPTLLAAVLKRIYGRTYGAEDQEFSVLELVREGEDEDRARDRGASGAAPSRAFMRAG